MINEKELQKKILCGIKKAIDKLITVSQQNDDYLVISENDKIVRVRARDLKKL